MSSYRAVNNIRAVGSISVDVDAEVEDNIVCTNLVTGLAVGTIIIPSYTQTDKLALTGVSTGTSVLDTTSSYISYYTGVNWYVPSYISFVSSTTATQGDITWASSVASPDARISISGTTFTLLDVGVYIVRCSVTFQVNTAISERSVIINFRLSPSTDLAVSKTQITNVESSTNNASANISYILVHTNASDTYLFNYSSLTQGNASLNNQTHGFISRIL
jgi:hypothetical protein